MEQLCVPQAREDLLKFGAKQGTPSVAGEELVKSAAGLTVEFVYHKI